MKNSYNFIVGWSVWFLYTYCRFVLPKHYIEQYEYRLERAAVCINNGSCLACGCTTPQVMFAPKGCEWDKYKEFISDVVKERCYDKLMNKKNWEKWKSIQSTTEQKKN